ncbi:MAG: hypothetical protein KAR39_02740 [Thermoplasmata archaeon]|nr:hypothetical protein [Thermoplasmata archaeon]
MHDDLKTFPFTNKDVERIISHPDMPSAYVEWRELLPLLTEGARLDLGNILGWSYPVSRRALGSSRTVFRKAFDGISDDCLDRMMASLGDIPVIDFVNHFVPFMRNAGDLKQLFISDTVVSDFLDIYHQPRGKIPMPEHLMIEITKSCNFACTMCSSRTKGFRKELTMTLEDFGEIVRVLGRKASCIRLNGYGESTIIPGFMSYVNCLDEFEFRGLREIITNLSAPQDVYEELAARGFVIMASWDSTDKKQFVSIRRGANYPVMLSTLRKLGRSMGAEPERLVFLSTIQEGNIQEIEPLARFAAEIGAGLLIFNMVKEEGGSPWMNTRFGEIISQFKRAKDVADSAGIQIKVPDHLGSRTTDLDFSAKTPIEGCDMPNKEVLVHWDLETTVCNMFNPYSYGALFLQNVPRQQQSMEERASTLWNGPNARLFRERLGNGSTHPYCKECYFL